MGTKFLVLLFAATAFLNTANASDLQQSNTVQSNELITDFAVIKDASDSDVVGIFNLFKAGAGERGPTLLAISADETITAYVGDQTINCGNKQECRLPFIKDATYRVELKRFNGETFSTQTVLPNETRILAPNDNAIFNGNTAIEFSWIVARDNGPRGITLSVYLGEQIETCKTTGFVNWKTEGTAIAPAEYVSACQLPLRAKFSVFYVNPVAMPGVAGGTLKGYSTARIFFTYMDSSTIVESVKTPMTQQELFEITNSTSSPGVISETLMR